MQIERELDALARHSHLEYRLRSASLMESTCGHFHGWSYGVPLRPAQEGNPVHSGAVKSKVIRSYQFRCSNKLIRAYWIALRTMAQ